MFVSVMLLASCASSALYVDPDSVRLRANPALVKRITASPHGYFRFINIPFSEEVCRRFSDVVSDVPPVNLHGDAHLEQYAITDLGRGLTDFDDTSIGPAVIDLVRFGVSLQLTLRSRRWEAEFDALYGRFLDGYQAALENPSIVVPAPAIAETVRKQFSADRPRYFEWIATVMKSVDRKFAERIGEAMKPYVEAMVQETPGLESGFFEIVGVGRLEMGIGSALDQKYLVRVQGPSRDPLDDLVLEVKEVRDLSGIDCIQSSKDGNPFRVLVGQSRIAYTPYRYLGFLRLDRHTFWIHSWVDNYRELESPESFPSVEALSEVVYDVGVQLGLGHPKSIASPMDVMFRRALLDMVKNERERLRATSIELADLTEEAWRKFKAAVRSDS